MRPISYSVRELIHRLLLQYCRLGFRFSLCA